MPAKEAWGIEIGQTAIHAVKILRQKNDAIITDCFFRPLDSSVEEDEYWVEVESALGELVAQKDAGDIPAVVGLPGYSTLFRDFPMPQVAESEMAEVVSYEARQLIPHALEEVVWDYYQLREDEEAGEVGIALVCCRRDIVERYLAVMDTAGISVENMQVGPLALVNYLMYDSPPDDVALILDTGARSTDFVIVNDGAFWLRSFSISGSDLTKALMTKFSISYEEAEKLKLKMGKSKQAARTFRVVEPTLRQLCGEVQRSIGYYKSLFRGTNVEELICAGNTYLLPGIDQFMADNIGMATRTMTFPETIPVAQTCDDGELEDFRQVLGTATGLALQGVGLAEIEMSLLPEERRKQKLAKAKTKWAVLTIAVALIAVVVSFMTTGSIKAELGDSLKSIEQIDTSVKKAKKKIEKSQKAYSPLLNESRRISHVGTGRGLVLSAHNLVNRSLERANAQAEKGAIDRKFETKLEGLVKQWEEKAKKEWPGLSSDNKDELQRNTIELAKQISARTEALRSRQGRLFLTEWDYQIVTLYEVKSRKEDGEEGPDVELYTEEELNEMKEEAQKKKEQKRLDAAKPISAVQVKFMGYVVSSDLLAVHKQKAFLMQDSGILRLASKGGAEPIDVNNGNSQPHTIQIPALTPPPARIRLGEEVPEEQLKVKSEPFAEETIVPFSYEFNYRPSKETFEPVYTDSLSPEMSIPETPWIESGAAVVDETE